MSSLTSRGRPLTIPWTPLNKKCPQRPQSEANLAFKMTNFVQKWRFDGYFNSHLGYLLISISHHSNDKQIFFSTHFSVAMVMTLFLVMSFM